MHNKRERRCVACREPKQQSELLRIAKINDEFKLDISHKLCGRGAYVCIAHDCIEKTIKKRLFNKSFKMNVPVEIYDKLEEYEKNN